MQLPYLSKHNVLLALGISIILGLWIGIIWPGLARARNQAQRIVDTQANLNETATTLSNFISAKQEQADLEQARTELQAVFINPANPIGVISRLEELAANQNVSFDVNVGAVEPGNAVEQRTMTVTTTGELGQTFQFIQAVIHEPFALTPTAFTISATDVPNIVTVQLEGITYWHL